MFKQLASIINNNAFLRKYLGILGKTYKSYSSEHTLIHSASLAYFTLFAMLPMLYLSVHYVGLLVGNAVVQSVVADVLINQVGLVDISGVMEFMSTIDLESRSWYGEIIGIVVLLFSCTALLIALKKSINEFFDLEMPKINKKRAFLNGLTFRLISVLLLGSIVSGLVILYFAQTILMSLSTEFLSNNFVGYIASWLIENGLGVVTNCLIVLLIFKYVHDAVISWKVAFKGALFTGVLLYLGQLLIQYYIQNFFFASGAGIAGTLFVILVWVFYSAQIIFFGAKFTKFYAIEIGEPIKQKFKTQEEIDNSLI